MIRPALSAEEWAKVQRLGDEAVLSITGPGDAREWGAEIVKRQGAPDLHALAALCLHGQAFGFWPELPRTLRIAAEKLRVLTDSPDDWVNLEEAADRIEALLPPEAP